MPSPFPGVDPFLEPQGKWPDFHLSFIYLWRQALRAVLPDHYRASIEERITLAALPPQEGDQQVRPDLTVLQRKRQPSDDQGGVAVAQPPTDLAATTLMLPAVEELPERFIEIRRMPNRKVVAVLELLSPANKQGPGREQYLSRRAALLAQPIHLVEIDLLQRGARLPVIGPLPTGDCLAMISRSDRRPQCDVYAWPLQRPLPTLPVPLALPDEDVHVDYQAVFDQTFDDNDFPDWLDYSQNLRIPVSPDALEWVHKTAK